MQHTLIPAAIALGIISLLVATGKGEFSAGTFTYDPRDSKPAIAETTNP